MWKCLKRSETNVCTETYWGSLLCKFKLTSTSCLELWSNSGTYTVHLIYMYVLYPACVHSTSLLCLPAAASFLSLCVTWVSLPSRQLPAVCGASFSLWVSSSPPLTSPSESAGEPSSAWKQPHTQHTHTRQSVQDKSTSDFFNQLLDSAKNCWNTSSKQLCDCSSHLNTSQPHRRVLLLQSGSSHHYRNNIQYMHMCTYFYAQEMSKVIVSETSRLCPLTSCVVDNVWWLKFGTGR